MLGFLSSGAKEFQSSGHDTAKPIRTERVRGTVKSPRAADQRAAAVPIRTDRCEHAGTGMAEPDHAYTCRPVTRV